MAPNCGGCRSGGLVLGQVNMDYHIPCLIAVFTVWAFHFGLRNTIEGVGHVLGY
jgi:hypothetical protein